MLTTIAYDRLTLERLPWVTFGLVLLWLGAFAFAAGDLPAFSLDAEAVTAGGLLGHWLFQESGAQLLAGILLLWVLGPVLEEAWGRAFFAGFLLAMALYTAGAYLAFQPETETPRPLVGGAGMLAALLGACIARQLKDGIHYTLVFWFQELRHTPFWIPAFVLPVVWFAGEVLMQLGADAVGPTRGLTYAGQGAGFAMGAVVGFGLRHFDLEQSWLNRRPVDAPDVAIEGAELLLRDGRADAALRALQPAVAARPHDAELVAALCRAAVAAREPQAARDPFRICLMQHMKSDQADLAARLWKDWALALSEPEVDPRFCLPLAQSLAAGGHGIEAARLLRRLLENPRTVSTGMALRIVEIARTVHAGVAIRAATVALEGGEFPEAKRARIEAIVRELEARRAEQLDPELDVTPERQDRSIEIDLEEEDLSKPPPAVRARPETRRPAQAPPAPEAVPLPETVPEAPTPALAPDDHGELFGSSDEMELTSADVVTDTAPLVQGPPVGTAPRVAGPGEPRALARPLMPLQAKAPAEESVEKLAAAEPRFPDAKCIEVVPVVWEGRRLSLQQGSGAPAWLDLAQVQAVAAAGVAGMAARPVVLIDLLLNWSDVREVPLRVLRLRSDRFDPARLRPGVAGGLDGFRAILVALLDQSGATPLPDAEQARGQPFARFDRLDAYEREVLSIER